MNVKINDKNNNIISEGEEFIYYKMMKKLYLMVGQKLRYRITTF